MRNTSVPIQFTNKGDELYCIYVILGWINCHWSPSKSSRRSSGHPLPLVQVGRVIIQSPDTLRAGDRRIYLLTQTDWVATPRIQRFSTTNKLPLYIQRTWATEWTFLVNCVCLLGCNKLQSYYTNWSTLLPIGKITHIGENTCFLSCEKDEISMCLTQSMCAPMSK